jgi:general secretion pathway protein N
MKKPWLLVALGIGAFLLLALITLPAGVVLSFVHPEGVTLSGVSGTLWHGRAQAVRAGALHVGGVEWNLHVLRLFTGRVGADIKVTRSDGFARASIVSGPGAAVTLRGLDASLPVSALPANVAPGGWTGTLTLKFAELALDNAWPVAANGTAEVANLVGPANRPAALGGYKVIFEGGTSAEGLTGALSDTGGPLAVNGTVQLKKDRSYLVSGMIATRPGAPSEMTRTLEILGAPDAQGRREFTLEGSM